jgi:hypothetical protein
MAIQWSGRGIIKVTTQQWLSYLASSGVSLQQVLDLKSYFQQQENFNQKEKWLTTRQF